MIHFLHVLSWVLLVAGFFFILAGVIGVLRLPDFYTRLHAQGKCDTLGVALMLGGLALLTIVRGLESEHGLELGHVLTALKIAGILFFIGLANPTATHALGRAAHLAGLEPWTKKHPREGEMKP